MSDQPKDTPAVDEAATADRGATQGSVPGRDGGPQDEADMKAAEGLQAPKETQEGYDEMLRRGAEQKGEGRVP